MASLKMALGALVWRRALCQALCSTMHCSQSQISGAKMVPSLDNGWSGRSRHLLLAWPSLAFLQGPRSRSAAAQSTMCLHGMSTKSAACSTERARIWRRRGNPMGVEQWHQHPNMCGRIVAELDKGRVVGDERHVGCGKVRACNAMGPAHK